MHPIEDESIFGAWLQAASHLAGCDERLNYNVILQINDPASAPPEGQKLRETVDNFLKSHQEQSLDTVAATIFPLGLYRKFGTKGIFETYPDIVFPQIKTKPNDWGRYAYRLVRIQDPKNRNAVLVDIDENPINPLEVLVTKLSNYQKDPKRAAYELNIVDTPMEIPIYKAESDRNFRQGGPCLSHISFKVLADRKTLSLEHFRK